MPPTITALEHFCSKHNITQSAELEDCYLSREQTQLLFFIMANSVLLLIHP